MRYYQRWLSEDVFYIISPEEKSVFQKLTTTEEREKFIEDFWRRRDPSPETMQNEGKEEHYRRIAYSNDHFASGKPGWLTDRGMIYIKFGPADRKETNPTGTHLTIPNTNYSSNSSSSDTSSYANSPTINMTTYPFEVWEYRYLEGIGTDIRIEFVDSSGTNDYRIALNDYEKDALFSITGSHTFTNQTYSGLAKDQPFERLEVYAKLNAPPPIKFKKLEEAVSARVTYNQLPVETQDSYIRLTDESVLTAVAVELENKNLTFEGVGDFYQATMNIFGRVSDISRRIIEVFEDTVTANATGAEVKQGVKGKSIYQKKLTLRPGRYVLDAVVEDLVGNRMGTIQKLLLVPRFPEGTLAASSLIVASALAPVVQASDLKSQFVIGDAKVIPNVLRRFKKSEKVGLYLQIYNLTLDQVQLKPATEITATIKKGSQIVRTVPSTNLNANLSGQQITLTGVVDTSDLEPGEYTVEISVTDKIASKSVSKPAAFVVL
jgi:GWxTD domain-containing protein